jgi:hypothetical protein
MVEKVDGPGTTARYKVTAAGEDVLAGKADALKLTCIDRRFGGIHLEEADVSWRWNGSQIMVG